VGQSKGQDLHFGYEGVSQGLGSTNFSNVTTQAARNGLLTSRQSTKRKSLGSTRVYSGEAQVNVVDGGSQRRKFSIQPALPITHTAEAMPHKWVSSFPITRENFLQFRADHNFSEKDRIFHHVSFDKHRKVNRRVPKTSSSNPCSANGGYRRNHVILPICSIPHVLASTVTMWNLPQAPRRLPAPLTRSWFWPGNQ